MTIETWLLPSLIALIFNGVTTFLPKIVLRSLKVLDLVVYHAFFFFCFAAAAQLFYGWPVFELRGVLLGMASGIVGTLGQLLYLLALQRGPLTHVSMVSSLYPLVATVLAFAILQEPLTLRQAIGVLLGICSIVLLVESRDKR